MEIYIDAGFELKRKRSIGSFNGKKTMIIGEGESCQFKRRWGQGGLYYRNSNEQSEGMGKRERG